MRSDGDQRDPAPDDPVLEALASAVDSWQLFKLAALEAQTGLALDDG